MFRLKYCTRRIGVFLVVFLTIAAALIYQSQPVNESIDIAAPETLDIERRALTPSLQIKLPPHKTTKVILAWTKFFTKDFLVWSKSKPVKSRNVFKDCPVKDCEWSVDRGRLNESDAVLFHIFLNDFSLNDLPEYRTPDQNYIFFNLEPPIRFKEGKMGKLDGLFNLTLTYEDDSDILAPYGYFYKLTKPNNNYLPDMSAKNKSIVWMVSRCNTMSRREIYADDLKRHIDIDIFGACGKPAPKKGSPPINLDFRKELANKYYFYLAFENSDCKDYITEKLWSSYLAGLVPIVRGQMPRYEKHVPPGSYINADAFFSYKDLAEYLHYLIKNPSKYQKYFEWKKYYGVKTFGAFQNLNIHCDICEYLHKHDGERKPAYDMSHRYSTTERCFNYHNNLPMIKTEIDKAYNDELKDFLGS